MPFSSSTVIFGCGNILLGDDGFGPAVIRQLEADKRLPSRVTTVDAGTGIREYLFDYLLAPDLRPKQLIILDSVDFPDRKAGEVFAVNPGEIPPKKIHDFSLHQFPTINLLAELGQETGMEITILAAQIESIPDQVAPGLSLPMEKAVAVACSLVTELTACSGEEIPIQATSRPLDSRLRGNVDMPAELER